MKRIMNDVALATILYAVPLDTEVLIVDADHYLHIWTREPIQNMPETMIQHFTVDEILHDYRNVKICRSKVYRISVKDGLLMFVIDTKNEKY